MACDRCLGGWLIVEKNGHSGAERCPCSIPRQEPAAEHSLTPKKVEDAVGRLGALEFFPKAPEERMAVAEMIVRMVWSQEQLVWLVQTMMDRVGRWHGPLELRGVFCSRFDPKDGVQATCALSSGFTGAAFEARAALGKPDERAALAPPLVRELAGQIKRLA